MAEVSLSNEELSQILERVRAIDAATARGLITFHTRVTLMNDICPGIGPLEYVSDDHDLIVQRKKKTYHPKVHHLSR